MRQLLEPLQNICTEWQLRCLASVKWASSTNGRGAEERGEEDEGIKVLPSLIRMLVEVGAMWFLLSPKHTMG